ncbi:MAG: 50S ribosomal protein L31 [Halanaerobiales bacterium]
MQKELHPEFKETTITCACGEEYKTMSTRDKMRVEVCSSCHPFYTGKKRRAAKGGRVERFNEKYGFSNDEQEDETEEE